jgi:hypothetical protein
MSQSDYIQHKRLSVMVKDLANQQPVLDSEDYTQFKQYTLENTITTSKPTLNQLTQPNYQKIFGMEKKVSSCPNTQFNVCKNTNQRSNRVLNTLRQFAPSPMTFTIQKKIVPK